MNTIQMPIDRSFVNNQQIRPQRKKRIMYKTNPLVKIRRFPTFGDIRKNVEVRPIDFKNP